MSAARTTRRLHADERGAMVLEFGVVFPLVVLVISGIVWFGMAFSTKLTMDQAAREGVRVYALTGLDGTIAPATRAADTVAAATAVFPGTVSCGTGTPDSTGACSTDCNPQAPGSPPATAWVRVDHAFSFPLAKLFPVDSLNLSATAVLRCGG